MLNEVILECSPTKLTFFYCRFVSEMYIPLIGVDLIKCVMNRIVPSIHRHTVTSNPFTIKYCQGISVDISRLISANVSFYIYILSSKMTLVMVQKHGQV